MSVRRHPRRRVAGDLARARTLSRWRPQRPVVFSFPRIGLHTLFIDLARDDACRASTQPIAARLALRPNRGDRSRMRSPLRAGAAALLTVASGCSFHTTSTQWHGLRDEAGRPVFAKSSSNVGFNLLVLIPLAGNTTLDAMIDEVASEIATQGGGRVRLVQTGTENYWYGWSPFTWIVTPVITTVVMEYEPSAAAVEAAELTNKARALRQAARARGDNSHVIPPKR